MSHESKRMSLKIPWVAILCFIGFVRAQNQIEIRKGFLEELQPKCPKMVPMVFENKVPAGRAGDDKTMQYSRVNATSVEECFDRCCTDKACNMVFLFLNNSKISCFKTTCTKDELCLPADPDPNKASKLMNKSFILLVRPTVHQQWSELNETYAIQTEDKKNKQDSTFPAPASRVLGRVCEVGLDLEACYENEECVAAGPKSRNGVCQCKQGFIRDELDECQPENKGEEVKPEPRRITVQVISKEVQLPENSATLTAYAMPEDPSYAYEWKLLTWTDTTKSKPKQESSGDSSVAGNAAQSGESEEYPGSMKNGNTQQLSLSNLVQGVYQFKVLVTGKEANGEALGNVTVLPPKHTNEPPKAVLLPKNQQINLPTSKAIIDASGSSDDAPKDQLTYKWEMLSEPLGYSPTLKTGPTLTLDGLIAGNYTVKVTVTDEDGASDSTEAYINVEPEKDYPPTANAGEDVIIYLPQNSVVLHGNQSSDDHGIVSWEWTRKSAGENAKELAADSTSMRTPHPQLSNLEEGMYTFTLKVSDVKGQTSEDDVNVYVKAAINLPPVANAGDDIEMSLPKNWVVLDGSKSKDDIAIVEYLWEQISEGPNTAKIVMPNDVVTNVTGLTKGVYTFQLTVKDNLNNPDVSTMKVTVTQDANMEPKAKAGDDLEVSLPISVVVLNGSNSWDDLAIAKWQWTRDPKSLAAGKIVGKSDSEPVLRLVDLVPGEYIFNLQVWDEQGKSSTDSVTITVRDNPDRLNVIRAVFNEDIASLTQDRLEAIKQGLALLINSRSKYKLKVLDVIPQEDTNHVVMHFIVILSTSTVSSEDADPDPENVLLSMSKAAGATPDIASGKKVVNLINTKLRADSELLNLQIVSLDTLVCQNECSGHGTCHQATRSCICEAFWVENFVRKQLMDGKSNCEWSIIYVGTFLTLMCGLILCLFCYFSFKRKGTRQGSSKGKSVRSRTNSRQKYSRLEQSEPAIEMRNAYTSSLMISESESEDEVIFQSSPPNGSVLRNGNVQKRNGFSGQTINSPTNA